MAETKKEQRQKQEIPAMRGTFAIRGIVTSFDKVEGFERKTKNGKNMREISFDVTSSEGNVHRMRLQAFTSDKVYFSGKRKKENGEEERVTQEVAWNERLKFKEEGLLPIDRVSFGLEKEVDPETGKEENKKETMFTYDAIEKIYNLLTVGASVYVRGNIQVEEYTKQNGEKGNATKFFPTQISLTQKPIDFNAEDFKEQAVFELNAIAEEIEESGSDEFTITGLVIGNQKLGRQTLMFKNDPSLPEDFKLEEWVNPLRNFKRAKKYIAATFVGYIVNTVNVEEEEEDGVDEWGIKKSSKSILRRTVNSHRREFLCTGIVSGTVDNETYTEESVDKFISQFIKPKDEFGEIASNADDFAF